jgi:hypothetical protein
MPIDSYTNEMATRSIAAVVASSAFVVVTQLTTIVAVHAETKTVYPYCPAPLCAPLWQRPIGCVDTYCAKRLPVVGPVCGGACDDYCGKRLPVVQPFACGECVDYRSKWGPIHFEACFPPWYRCGPCDGQDTPPRLGVVPGGEKRQVTREP